MRRLACIFATLLLAASAAGAAGGPDPVSVHAVGGTAAKMFSPGLRVDVALVDDYTKTGFDGKSGNWLGPPYYSGLMSPAGNATIAWHVAVMNASPSAAIAATLTHGWPTVEQGAVDIDQIPGGDLGLVRPGMTILTMNPAPDSAQYEGALGFPLCRGVSAVVDFEALAPATGHAPNHAQNIVSTTHSSVPAGQWNHDTVLSAFKQVSLVGLLPPGRIKAKVRRRVISGHVTDCAGQGMIGLNMKVGKRTVKTDASADFAARVTKPGRYRIVASVAGQTKTATVRVH